MSKIISADEIKKTIANYSPARAEKYHTESAKLADQEFDIAIRSKQYDTVILMSGGAASGKTEFLASHLVKRQAIIVDTTLPTVEGARIKIRKATKFQKKIEIYAIIPDTLSRAFVAFLHRDRKFSDEHFYRTHSGSRGTLLWIAENHPNIQVHLIESSYTHSQKLRFTRLQFTRHEELIQHLQEIQRSEADIISEIQLRF